MCGVNLMSFEKFMKNWNKDINAKYSLNRTDTIHPDKIFEHVMQEMWKDFHAEKKIQRQEKKK